MGEPIFNEQVFHFTENILADKRKIFNMFGLRVEVIHPVLTTSLPKYKFLERRLHLWASIKNNLFNGQAGLQFSINTTDEEARQKQFGGNTLTIKEIAYMLDKLPEPLSRKYCLNFAVASDTIICAEKLVSLFDPNKFMVKITPIHETKESIKHGMKTINGYSSYHPYQKYEEELKKIGFDVLVFVPSLDEEQSTITCGNAVLGGSEIKVKHNINFLPY
jgi:23S rRNA (adenine2503-C2)-methyltransferase